MLLKNALLLTENFTLQHGDLRMQGDRITEIGPSLADEPDSLDCGGALVVPGFVDIHTHGAENCDFANPNLDGLTRALQYDAKQGVTTVLPTMMTEPPEMIDRAMDVVRAYRAAPPANGAWVPGVHLEGPFFSLEKCGAQPPEWLIEPSVALFDRWNRDGLVRLIAVAPELPNAMDFIRAVSAKCAVAIGHTTADYEITCAAFEAGATDATHLYNGMVGATHRAPGTVGAVWDTPNVFAELICDGRHIHPAIVRATFNLIGDRIAMISDSLMITGQPEGTQVVDVSGARLTIRDGRAELDSGTIAGCCVPLAECVRRAISFGIAPEKVFRAASLNPARVVGLDNEVGTLSVGKRANILLLNADYTPKQVFVNGNAIL